MRKVELDNKGKKNYVKININFIKNTKMSFNKEIKRIKIIINKIIIRILF